MISGVFILSCTYMQVFSLYSVYIDWPQSFECTQGGGWHIGYIYEGGRSCTCSGMLVHILCVAENSETMWMRPLPPSAGSGRWSARIPTQVLVEVPLCSIPMCMYQITESKKHTRLRELANTQPLHYKYGQITYKKKEIVHILSTGKLIISIWLGREKGHCWNNFNFFLYININNMQVSIRASSAPYWKSISKRSENINYFFLSPWRESRITSQTMPKINNAIVCTLDSQECQRILKKNRGKWKTENIRVRRITEIGITVAEW